MNVLYETGAFMSCMANGVFFTHCPLTLNSYHLMGLLQKQEARYSGWWVNVHSAANWQKGIQGQGSGHQKPAT